MALSLPAVSNQASQGPKLPLELFEHIIDFLQTNPSALGSCSLTCKSWLPRTRYHRFKRLTLDYHSSKNFQTLLDESPEIAFYVRQLNVCRQQNPLKRTIPMDHPWVDRVFPEIARKLTEVVKMEIDDLVVDDEFARALVQNFERLEDVRVVRCTFVDIADVFNILVSFPEIRRIKFVFDTVISRNEDLGSGKILKAQNVNPEKILDGVVARHNTSSKTLPKLNDLRFPVRIRNDTLAPQVMKYMLSTSLHTNIQTLEIPGIHAGDIDTVQDLLNVLGPTLMNLRFGFQDRKARNGDELLQLDLSPCTNLLYLGIWGIHLSVSDLERTTYRHHSTTSTTTSTPQLPPTHISPLAWVPNHLLTLTSPHLQQICLRIHASGTYDNDNDFTTLDWSKVGKILNAKKKFGGLREVKLRVYGSKMTWDRLVGFVEGFMGDLKEGGVHVVYSLLEWD